MSARDDYPDMLAEPWQQHEAMCDEIDRLRAWKAEAIQVISMWEECYDVLDRAGHGARIGQFKSDHVRRWIERDLRTRGPGDPADEYADPVKPC